MNTIKLKKLVFLILDMLNLPLLKHVEQVIK